MAFQRYKNTGIKRREDGKRVKTTTLPPKVEKSASDIYIFVRVGDRLDLLAHEYYGSPTDWVVIAAANNLKEIIVDVGQQIRIPSVASDVRNEWNNQNLNR